MLPQRASARCRAARSRLRLRTSRVSWSCVPILDAFLEVFPTVSALVTLMDRHVNLIEEGIDVALRIGHLEDSSMIAMRVGEVRRVVVAAPRYPQAASANRAAGNPDAAIRRWPQRDLRELCWQERPLYETSKPQVGKPRMIRRPWPGAIPVVLAFRFLDRQIVDRRKAPAHQPVWGKLPVLVAI